MKQKILIGPRVKLRPLQMSDAERYVRWFADKQVVRYLLLQTGITIKEERKYIRNLSKQKNHFNFAIVNENGKHIGGSGSSLYPRDKRANMGLVIGEKDEWGKGYAKEVLNLIINYVFRELKYNRLELSVDMGNIRALKVYKKVGFKLEGVKKQYRWNLITKRLEDEGMMAILKKDWLKK